MAHGKDYLHFILDDINGIKKLIAQVSDTMFDYICKNTDSRLCMYYKYLTHSDLATFGKATRPDSLEKNLLYYIETSEMKNIELKTEKKFQTAHQSSIGLNNAFYEKSGLPNPRDKRYLINDYCNVFLCNDNLQYFTAVYTKKVFKKLKKVIDGRRKASWDFDQIDIIRESGQFTPISIHCSVHGLGEESDTEFHKLRHHLFNNDTMIILFEEKQNGSKNMFLLFEKNPVFFSIIGETNKAYENYQKQLRDRLIKKTLLPDNAVSDSNTEDEVTRQQQSAWRKMLAQEMMGYTSADGQVFCPFTFITCDFNTLGALFVASHIKGFSDANTTNEEKYDINNGLLLCSNADALFDKHLISVNQDKELVFSFLFDNDNKLKSQLLLMQPIFQPVLNEKRMEYLKYHFKVFTELEQQRKQ